MAVLLFVPLAIIVISAAIFSAGTSGIFRGLDLGIPNLNLKLQVADRAAPSAEPGEVATPGTQPAPRTVIRPAPPAPFLLNTVITAGPKQNEVISRTNKVRFEFAGVLLPEEPEERITFETKIEGIDLDWKATSAGAREITLPAGPGEYTFLARSKLGDQADATPDSRTFIINISPYFEKVAIRGVSPPRDSRPSRLTLSTKLPGEETATITGWKLEGRTDEYVIPQGRETFAVFDTSKIPKTDIILKNGTQVFLSTGVNPLANNFNFQPNDCFGHFAADRDFPMSVPRSCADSKPAKEEVSFLSPACQDFILRADRCELPEYTENPDIVRDFDCFVYFKEVLEDRYSYEYCYQQHSQDRNFVKNEWHIYTDGEDFLRPVHDRVELRDRNGLYVHEYLY